MIEKINNEQELDAALDACAKYCEEHTDDGVAMFCIATLNDTDMTAKIIGNKEDIFDMMVSSLEHEIGVREIWTATTIGYAKLRAKKPMSNPNVN